MKIIVLLVYAITGGDTSMALPVQLPQKSMEECQVEAARITHKKGGFQMYGFCVEGHLR